MSQPPRPRRLAESSWPGRWGLRYAASMPPSLPGSGCFSWQAASARRPRAASTSPAPPGGPVLLAGLSAAPLLAHGNPGLTEAYRIAFASSIIAFVGSSYTFALQARDTRRWNLVRVSQPLLALAAITLLWRLRLLTLHTAIGVLTVTMAIQLGYAYFWCRRTGLAPGSARTRLIAPLARYGLSQLAAVTPATVNAYLDQLVLSQLVPPAALGRYAIR